jgi:Nucleotidyl transferase AbiEii toxin, Type IV TA system
VRLEIGPLASWVPSARHTIRPYASEILPELFESPACEVVAITAERTFWEKATILHQEAHRETQIPQRYSRHYYDLYKLAVSPIRTSALAQIGMQDVVEFKRQFYPSTWARYDLAVPGKFKLLPTTEPHLRHLERDYREMQVMLFGERPEFGSILSELRKLESEINSGQHDLSMPPAKQRK